MAEAEQAIEQAPPLLLAMADSPLSHPQENTTPSLVSESIDNPSSTHQLAPPIAQASIVAHDLHESQRGVKRPREDGQDCDPHAEDRLVETVSHDSLHPSAQDEHGPSAKRTCADGSTDAAKLEGDDDIMEEPSDASPVEASLIEDGRGVEVQAQTGVEVPDEAKNDALEECETEAGAQGEEDIRGASVEGRTRTEDKDEALDQEEPKQKELIDDNQKPPNAGLEGQNGTGTEDDSKEEPKEVKLGPRVFTSSVDMLNFFYELLHGWPINVTINKYEHMMLMDLISKGHQDPPSKIGIGIKAFQIQVNPEYYSRCYYLIRNDGSTDNFSYRKCVDKLLPLPANMSCLSDGLGTDQSRAKGSSGQKGGGNYRGRGGPTGGKRFHGNNKGRGGRFGGSGGFGKGSYGHGHPRDH